MSTSCTAPTFRPALFFAGMACGLALFVSMASVQATAVSAWDINGVAANSNPPLTVGELATGGGAAGPNPVVVAGAPDPYSTTSASASYVAQSVAGANSSTCQSNKLVSCVTLTSYPQAWSCSCKTPTHPGSAPEPGNLALLGIGLLALLLSQSRAKRRAA